MNTGTVQRVKDLAYKKGHRTGAKSKLGEEAKCPYITSWVSLRWMDGYEEGQYEVAAAN